MLEINLVRRARAPFSERWTRQVVEEALKAAKSGAGTVGVVLTGDAEMRKLNREFRGKDCTTDVLSFEGGGEDIGDVVISVPQARRQAAEAGRSLRSEIAELLVHGTLHLLGYDHETKREAEVMFPLQKKALKKLGL